MAAEATVICMDTSCWMQSVKSHQFKEQADAIELYCAKKLKAHPQNVVGICGSSESCIKCVTWPTRDLGYIMKAIYCVRIDRCLILRDAIVYANHLLPSDSDMQKRIVMFAGGTVRPLMYDVERLGQLIKERNLACDIVNFGDQSRNKKDFLDTLIAAADNNGNCRILHVEPTCSVRRALSRSPLIPQDEEGGSGIIADCSLSIEEEKKMLEPKDQSVSQKIQLAKMDARDSQKIQQPKLDPSTQILKLKLALQQKKEQIDALTRENENLKRELELFRKDKNQYDLYKN